MSKPVLKRSEYDYAAERELARWPGAALRREALAKHARLVLTFQGQTRCVVYPRTGSDWRGPMNHVGDIRKVLLEMGATRLPDPRSAQPKRQRNHTQPHRVYLGEKAVKDPSRDPWAILATLELKERPVLNTGGPPVSPPRSLWHRLTSWLLRKGPTCA